MSRPARETYVFGDFRLNLAEHLLTRQGQPVALAPKVFDTLVILVQNAGQLISKDDFIAQLWPGIFVEEVALAQNISQLRKALGDSADGAQIIQTVPKRGYRFALPVRLVDDSQKANQPSKLPLGTAAPSASARRTSAILKRGAFVAAGLFIFLAATLSFQWITQPSEPRLLRMTPITASGRAEPWGEIHVDGSRVYFLERHASTWSLTQTSVTGGEPARVAAPFPNTRIFGLSPDRSEFLVGSFTDLAGNMPLWTMPAQGGPPHRVGDVVVDDAVWFPDGKRILATLHGEVFSVELDGGNRRHWFSVNGTAVDFSWRPDGHTFRFTVTDANGDLSLWEASSDGGNPHLLLPNWSRHHAECCGVWMPNGRDYVFSAIRDGGEDLWVLREPEGLFHFQPKPMRLTAGPYDFSTPAPSLDGKRIFVFGVQNQEKLFRYDTQRGDFLPFPISGIHVALSRDGGWLAYVDPAGTMWRSRSDGTERMQLTSRPLWATRPRWSPDGKQILFVGQMPGAQLTPYVVQRDGGAPVPAAKDAHGGYADWQPDGESIVLDALDSTGPNSEMSIIHLKTGESSKVSGSTGLIEPRWSPDGRYIAAISADFKTLHLYDARQRQWSQLASARHLGRFQWGTESRDLYFQDLLDPQEAIFRWDASNGKVNRVFDFSKPLLLGGAIRCSFEGFAPDGSYLTSFRFNFSNVYALDVDLQ
jgi:DNA-binding winged helix-turn-helix (wHTH) protein/Tol biopolymer transport system component